MAYFELEKSLKISEQISSEDILNNIKLQLSNHYQVSDFKLENNSLSLYGNLLPISEWAVTKATINLDIQSNEVKINVGGNSGLGKLGWFILGLGFFSGGLITLIFILIYLNSKDLPRRYINEALQATRNSLQVT